MSFIHKLISLLHFVYSEDDDDDVSSSFSNSFHAFPLPMSGIRPRGSVPVLPMVEGPPIPPRHTTPPQNTFSSGSGGRGPLPPLPQQQQPAISNPQLRPPPVASRTARPQSASYGRSDSGQFGPGKQEKEVRILNTYRNCILSVGQGLLLL